MHEYLLKLCELDLLELQQRVDVHVWKQIFKNNDYG